jgi:hypothetical protein
MSETGDKNQTKKSVQVLLDISLNTLRVHLGNHCVGAIGTKKTRAFRSGSSRTTLALTCNNPLTIRKIKAEKQWQVLQVESKAGRRTTEHQRAHS